MFFYNPTSLGRILSCSNNFRDVYFQTTSTSIVLAVVVVLETAALLAFCQKDYNLLTRLWAWLKRKFAAKKEEDEEEEIEIVTATTSSSSPSPPPSPPSPSTQALPAPTPVRALPTPPPIRALGYEGRPVSAGGSSEW